MSACRDGLGIVSCLCRWVFHPNLQHSGVYHTTGQGRKQHYHGIWWIIRPAPTNSFRAGFLLIRPSRQAASSCSPCAGYLAHPFSKETVFTLEFRRCDPSFPAFFPGSRILQEGNSCLDHDDLSICSPSAIRLFPERPVFTCYTTGC